MKPFYDRLIDIRHGLFEAKRLFDAARQAARAAGTLDVFDMPTDPEAADGAEDWSQQMRALDEKYQFSVYNVGTAYPELSPRLVVLQHILRGLVPPMLEHIDAATGNDVDSYWVYDVEGVYVNDETHWKVFLNNAEQRRAVAELEASWPVFWHPGHFLDSLVLVPEKEEKKAKKKRSGKKKKIAQRGKGQQADTDHNKVSVVNGEGKRAADQEGSSANDVSNDDQSNDASSSNEELTDEDASLSNQPRFIQCCHAECGEIRRASKMFGCMKCRKFADRMETPFETSFYCNSDCQLADWNARHHEFHQKMRKEWKEVKKAAFHALYDVE